VSMCPAGWDRGTRSRGGQQQIKITTSQASPSQRR